MCGIFGYVSSKIDGEDLLRVMARQQIHRGPDSEGFYIDGSFGFGIRRLSVIDLVTGNQPISNEDKSIWVVCNGEIYNYRELVRDLKEKGHKFYTESDVECIVHLYEEYGIECLEYLNGMFGLTLYDKKKKCLFIARDRLGIKPLYYSSTSEGFLFSSELKSLLATNLIRQNLDWNYLSCFLDLNYIPTPGTPFQEVAKLTPGHFLQVSGEGHPVETPYWNLSEVRHLPPSSETEAIEKLTYLLRDSSRLQLRADVPICAFLSGGIDSSAVVAFAAMESSYPLRTYHVYFTNATEKMDERRFARLVAERYGTVHTEVEIDRVDFDRLIPQLIWHLEEPFGDLASVPTYIISQMARKEVTVCLNGSGGDELFAGYYYHSHISLLKHQLLSGLNKIGVGDFLRTILGKSNNPTIWGKLFPNYQKESLRVSPQDPTSNFPGDRLNRLLAKDINGYLQSNILFLLDKITMAVSLEGRVPLLDHRLVEFGAYLPSKWKLKKGERKYIFKKMLEPYLPREVLHREKEGFGGPLNDWLDDKTKGILLRIVEGGLLRKYGLIKIDNIRLSDLKAWDLWKVVCMEIWYRVIVESLDKPSGIRLMDFA